jgi:hypothetical protein
MHVDEQMMENDKSVIENNDTIMENIIPEETLNFDTNSNNCFNVINFFNSLVLTSKF